VGVGQLERVDHAQDLVEVAAGGLWIGDHQPDLLLGVDDEDRAHGVDLVVGGMHHPVEVGHLAVRIGHDREVRRVPLRVLDVLRPLRVRVDRIDRQADRLHAPPVELRLQPRHVAQLGRAHRGEVAGVREQDDPRVADPVVEVDAALRAVGREVGGGITQA